MTMEGAREFTPLPIFGALRRLVAGALARDLRALVVPGPDVARALGLDLEAAGLIPAEGPRQASVLVVIAPLPGKLRDAASVAYAQMPRPRALLALGGNKLSPLPAPDISAEPTQAGLETAMRQLRALISHASFAERVSEYSAPTVQSRIVYTCPMHPEIVSDEPGNCPKCGMFLVPRETSAALQPPAHEHGTSSMAAAAIAPDAHDANPDHAHGSEANSYTCPMHPEVISDQPGNCPKCGMTLVPAGKDENHAGHGHDHSAHHHHDSQAGANSYTCPMHPEVTSDQPGNCPKCGMTLVPAGEGENHAGHGHDHSAHHHHDSQAGANSYTCPMHPEVISDQPGNCPKCGMTLVPVEEASTGGPGDHASQGGHDHAAMQEGEETGWLERIEPGFMSMVEMTQGAPRSSDGLQMEWITVPFGPFFPGLPGGLVVEFLLDGDTVVEARTTSLAGRGDLLAEGPMPAAGFVDMLGARMPLAPVSYRLLACRAIESAAGARPGAETEAARDAALARERAASHLLWLAQLGRQLGLPRIESRAAALHRTLRRADPQDLRAQIPAIRRLSRQLAAARLLTRRLRAVGDLPDPAAWTGPAGPDHSAAGRLAARLADMEQALEAAAAAPALAIPAVQEIGAASGHGHAMIETARGTAHLHVTLKAGRVSSARLQTPSAAHVALVGPLTAQHELADALVAVASLDLDPWEIDA